MYLMYTHIMGVYAVGRYSVLSISDMKHVLFMCIRKEFIILYGFVLLCTNGFLA